MDMKQLEIFVTACERGSFSQAAACMYMTQPNISKSIRALEHELGRPLLIRNAKGVQPTAYGKTVLEHAQMILKTAATISSLAIPDEQNHLSLSTYPSNMAARLLVDFYQTWGSAIHIEHHEGTVEEITDRQSAKSRWTNSVCPVNTRFTTSGATSPMLSFPPALYARSIRTALFCLSSRQNPNSPFLQNTTRKGGVFCSDQNRLIPIRSAAYSVQI